MRRDRRSNVFITPHPAPKTAEEQYINMEMLVCKHDSEIDHEHVDKNPKNKINLDTFHFVSLLTKIRLFALINILSIIRGYDLNMIMINILN